MAKQTAQTVTAAQKWKQQMADAKTRIKDLGVSHQTVQDWVAEQKPAIDKLTNATRWRNAWACSNADPEFTELVEAAAEHFAKKAAKEKSNSRLRRQGLSKNEQ